MVDVAHHLLLLGVGHRGHEVVRKGGAAVLCVQFIDLGIRLHEDVLAELEFLNGAIAETKVSDVLHEK